jgi:PAS domain S-box-containing protein
MSPRPWYPAKIGAVAAVYFGAAKLGLLAAVAQKVVSSAWPPTGVALAALLLFGLRLWPGIALGAFLLNLTSGVPVVGAAGIAVGNTLEAVTAVVLLRRLAAFRTSLAGLRDVLALVTLAALGSTLVSATIGVLSLWSSGMIDRAATGPLWFVWWSGDAMGDVLVAPLLLAWAHAPRVRWPPARTAEAVVLLASLVGLTALLLRPPTGDEYAIFPLIIWAALRFGVLGSATASGIVAALTISATVHGQGSFVSTTPTHDLLLLQTYLALLSVTGLVVAAITTERREAEQSAIESEWRYRTLLENAPEPILVHQDGSWIFANRAALKLLHAERAEQLVGRPTLDIVHPDYRTVVRERIEREFATGEPAPLLEQQFVALDGTVIDVEVVGIPITLSGRQAGKIMVRDITVRRQAEQAVRERQAEARHSRERLEALSQRLLKALENERRFIARELHDQIGQSLTAVKLNLESLRAGPRGRGDQAFPLNESIEIVEQLMETVRSLSLELRPSALDDLGLAAALRWYADRQARRAGFAVRVRTQLPAERLASELETACFRVAQEAITNVARHAGARRVELDARTENGTLALTIRDDGRGFDVAAARRGTSADGSIGLDGMEERVRLLSGDFQIDSHPGRGTTVRARFPLVTT